MSLTHLCAVYRTKLNRQTPHQCNTTDLQHWQSGRLDHLAWMLEQIPTLPDRGKRTRWLVFAQGALWSEGLFTIDQMREHIRQLDPGELAE